MKVLMINGSPHPHGTTRRALDEIAETLSGHEIETEIMTIGLEMIHGCIACGRCNGHCVGFSDSVNDAIDKMAEADGLVIGTPVYFASPNGTLLSFLDRMFYAGGGVFAGKPAGVVAVARRGGTTVTLDALMKYPIIKGMPVMPSTYWPMVHGANAADAEKDLEGMQVMRNLGHNMAWMLKLIELGKQNGLPFPAPEKPRARTNFVR
ncbi:MAG: flavodoxin family protein [Clostridiales bacterium]|nr:flavodoxin family protein [Clostridiales bacterium]